jgi:hypothetical protein
MKALFDETVPMVKGHYAYVIVATLLIDDEQLNVMAAVKRIVGSRSRGFHWSKEGPAVRERAVDCLVELGACAHVMVHHPTGRRQQERARRSALGRLLPMAIHDGATELLIESRGERADLQDRITVLTALNELKRDDVTYGWRDKSTPELWLPDAVCGAVATFLNGNEPRWYETLQSAGVLTEPIYIKDA